MEKEPTVREACVKPEVIARLSTRMKKLVQQNHKKGSRRSQCPDCTLDLSMDFANNVHCVAGFEEGREDLRTYFKEYATRDALDEKRDTLGSLGLKEFKIICGLLNLDHSELEVEKIFRVIDMDTQGQRNGRIDFHAYVKVQMLVSFELWSARNSPSNLGRV